MAAHSPYLPGRDNQPFDIEPGAARLRVRGAEIPLGYRLRRGFSSTLFLPKLTLRASDVPPDRGGITGMKPAPRSPTRRGNRRGWEVSSDTVS